MKDLRQQPRWLQKIKAYLGGYFWIPCPICRKEFGGHEKCGYLLQSLGSGVMVCANCILEAERRNTILYEKAGWRLIE